MIRTIYILHLYTVHELLGKHFVYRVCGSRVLSSQPANQFFWLLQRSHEDYPEKLLSVQKYLRFSRACHLPALIETITGQE